MRLYLNDKDAKLIRKGLEMILVNGTKEQEKTAMLILNRMDLCDMLQNNEKKSK